MPLPPLTVSLTEGQKTEVLKRFRARYSEELERIEAQMQEILLANAEADFLAGFLNEQPEVKELRARTPELEALEKRRQHLGLILAHLDHHLPKQPPVTVAPPTGTAGAAAAPPKPGIRRY